jgi:hypothetical protein
LAKKILEEAAEIDAAEDERFGDRRGDELPPELATSQGRRGWLRDARRRLEEPRDREARPIPASRPARLKEAKRRLQEELWTECQANAAYEAYRARGRMEDGRRFGRPPDPVTMPATPQGKVNLTDPDSRNVKTSRGWVQGYNAQAATNARQIVIAAEVNADSPDFGHLQPMVDATQRELAAIGIGDAPSVLLADAGYWHQDQMGNIVNRGIQVLIPPDAGKRKTARPGCDGGLYSFMRRVLDTDLGGGLYAKRQGMIEPVFGHTKVQPPLRPLPTPRQIRGPLGMAADHRHPQPAQALAAQHRPSGRLTRLPATAAARSRGIRARPARLPARPARLPAFTQQPPYGASVCRPSSWRPLVGQSRSGVSTDCAWADHSARHCRRRQPRQRRDGERTRLPWRLRSGCASPTYGRPSRLGDLAQARVRTQGEASANALRLGVGGKDRERCGSI